MTTHLGAKYKKIFLVYPPSRLFHREDRCQVPVNDLIISPLFPPTDLLTLAAVAQREGHHCKFMDYTLYGHTVEDFHKDLAELKPDILVISTTTPTLQQDLSLCELIKQVLPGILIVAKGAHFLRLATQALEDFPALDMVMRGETEGIFKDIISDMDRGGIAGLTWRDDSGRIIENAEREFIDDLDGLPFPSRDLIDCNGYRMPDTGRPMGVIRVSRGCPHNCFFCLATPVSGCKVRVRSPENIIEEIGVCISKYNIRDFIFYADIFNFNRQWVMALCEAIRSSGLRFSWSANTRADTIDLETARMMRASGCKIVSMGVESGSQAILDRIGKNLSIEQIREARAVLKEAQLTTLAYYMLGLPWETRQTAKETIEFAIELDSDFASFFAATPFPGTRFYDYALDEGLLEFAGDMHDFHTPYYTPVVRGHNLGKDEISSLIRNAVRRFHLRPGYVLKRILQIRSFEEVGSYSRAAVALLQLKS